MILMKKISLYMLASAAIRENSSSACPSAVGTVR